MLMRKIALPVLLLLMAPSIAASQSQDSIEIVDLIKGYSEIHDQKFILDPRVRSTVMMIGIEIEDIDYSMLIKIFKVHGFDAIESDGVVYVVPTAVADSVTSFLESG